MEKIIEVCKLNELEKVLEKVYEEYEGEYNIFEVEDKGFGDEHRIDIDDIRVVIPEVGLSVRIGVFCNYDEDEQEYMPDFAISLVYDMDEENATNYLYWEQGTPSTAIYNFLSQTRRMQERDVAAGQYIIDHFNPVGEENCLDEEQAV